MKKLLKKSSLVFLFTIGAMMIPSDAEARWHYVGSQGFVGGTICDYYEYKIFGITFETVADCHL